MAKIKGSYRSLIKGVSEQVPHDRLEGQHTEQVNMVSDPIRGLTRRRGSKFLDSRKVETPNQAFKDSLKYYKQYTYIAEGTNYSLFFCTRPVPGGNGSPVFAFNKDSEELITGYASNAAINHMRNNGISTAVSVGRYLLLGIRDHVVDYTVDDRVEATRGNASIWIRGGDYARTYRVKYGSTVVEHTTPKSYYEGTLDTSDIPYDDEEYQKKVNDRVHAYNTQVNKYIAEAQKAITPEEIARELREKLNAKGIQAGNIGSNIHVYGLNDSDKTLVGDDGGNGNFMRVTHKTVGSLDDLTRYHMPGTVIQVEVSADDTFYVRADKKSESTNNFQEVVWREASREKLDIGTVFLIATEHEGRLYMAESSTELESILPSGLDLDVPDVVPREAGDIEDSSPLPDFFKRPISHMTLFQDRLVICSGANVFMSAPGDYFKWFRKTALRVDPDDPIEVYALGAEDDIIHESALIDRNLILIGESRHFAVTGRSALTPSNAIVSVQSSQESTDVAAPQSLGNLMFFAQYQGEVTKMHQMQVGAFADSFDSFSVTQQITEYIKGKPRQIVSSTQPDMLLLSTEGHEYGVYVFSFLDSPGKQERLFDSWSRWEWCEQLGKLVAMESTDNGFLFITLREGRNGWYLVADEVSRDSSTDEEPYLDSRVRFDQRTGWPLPLAANEEEYGAAVSREHKRRLYGKTFDQLPDVLATSGVSTSDVYVGAIFESSYQPTSPYPRDREDVALLSGRTILTNLSFTLARSAGIKVTMKTRGETEFGTTLMDDAGFRINDPLSPLGAVPLTDRQVQCYVGREIREHSLRVASRTWTPLTIATVEWTMQTFNRR